MSQQNSELESLPPELQERWQELVKSEGLFRTLFQSAPFMINSFSPEGKLLLWNQACTENLLIPA